MANQPKQDKPEPQIIELTHQSYRPSVAELNEDMRVDASLEELVKAVLQPSYDHWPAKIRYIMPRKRKP